MQVQYKYILISIFLIIFEGLRVQAQGSSKLFINTDEFKLNQGSEMFISASLEVDSSENTNNGGNIILTDSLINFADRLFMPSSYEVIDNSDDASTFKYVSNIY